MVAAGRSSCSPGRSTTWSWRWSSSRSCSPPSASPARRPRSARSPVRAPGRTPDGGEENACDDADPPAGPALRGRAPRCALPQRSPAAEAGLRPGDTIVAIGGTPVAPTAYDSWTAVQDAIRSSPGTPLDLTDRARRRPARPHRHPDREHRLRRGRRATDDRRPPATRHQSPGDLRPAARSPRVPGYFGMIVAELSSGWSRSRSACPRCSAPRSSARNATARPDRRRRRRPDLGRGLRAAAAHRTAKSASSSSCSPASTWCCSCSTCCRSTRSTAGTSPARCTRRPGHVARLRGRPDPGPFDIARLMPVAYVVAGLFLALSALLFIADIVNPITLG